MRSASASAAEKRRMPRYFSIEATVDVDIDPDDLHHEGWHHESECPAQKAPETTVIPTPMPLAEAVRSLHQQAHGSDRPITACHSHPCNWLTLEQLRGVS